MTQGATWSVFGPPSDVRFWKTADAAGAVWPLVTKIREDLTSQFDRYETALSLCTDSAASEITPGSRADAWAALDFEPLSLNVVETVCDTLHAEITQAQPRCMFLSVGGGYEMRRRIQKANRFVDGVFQECDVYGEAFPDCAHDAIRFGTGFVHVFAAHGKVQIERVHPWEILVDEVDGYDRKPRSMHRVKYMDRGQAAELWPEHATAIEAAGMPSGPWAIHSTYVADVIVVIESWHLPSGPDADDGRHVIVCDGATLVDEEWTRPNFPIAVMRWSRRPFGFYGRGVCEMLVGIQYNVNKTAIAIDIAHEQAGFQVWVERGAKINKAHIQNGIGTIGEFTGSPPVFMTPATVAPEMYQWLERQYQRAFERARTSSMAARAEIPAGLKNASGVALETYNDTTSKAYLPQAREYEGLAVDVGNPHLACVVGGLTHGELSALDFSGGAGFDPGVFPEGVNVELMTEPVSDGDTLMASMRVIERGVGETRSCGTGLVAAASALLASVHRDEGLLRITVPGGRVEVAIADGGGSSVLRGPSRLVARGELFDGALD